jgi:arylsulfatase A-like enzyme
MKCHKTFLPVLLAAMFAAVLLSVSHAAAAGAASGPAAEHPNLLFLFSDDQRYDTIAALGNEHIKTPNLDRLVDRGFVFRNTYCQGSMSGAVCYPSRAMVNSGRSLWRAPGNLQGVPTWPEVLRKRDYATFGTGKWHNGSASYARGFTHGGAIFFGGMSDHWKVPIHDFDPSGAYRKQDRRFGEKFSSELFADAAIDFLENRPREKPFYMYVSFTAPHDPRTPPGKYKEMYDPEKLPLPKNFLPVHPFDNGEMRIRDEMLAPFPRTPEVVRRHIADYYGMISHMDAQIGRILQKLRASGAAENTIIIFASDHGLSVGRHGLLGKQNLYEHAMRPPLVFTGPGIEKGQSEALVYLFDLFPTACDLLSVPIPAGVEGKSLVPIIRGRAEKVRDWVLGAYKHEQRMVREPRWKLIEYNVGGKKTRQLFDLENDPWEMNNLVEEPAAQGHLSRLERLLTEGRRKFDDPVDFE